MKKSDSRILVFYSAPGDAQRLRLDIEHREVEKILNELNLDRHMIYRLHATTVDDLTRALLQNEYEIVQFSGHGTKEGFLLESHNLENSMFVPADQIARILHETSPHIKAAIFMACYSAEAIPELVDAAPFLITVSGPANDDAAINFIAQFYNAYLHFESVEKAFNIAQNYIALLRKDSGLNVSLSRRAKVKSVSRVLYQAFPSGKDDSILIDLTEAESDIASLNITRDTFLGLLSRKIRIHRWIFSSPRQRVVLSLGPYFGLFSWENANDIVVCHRILRIKQDVDERTCEAWASLIVTYNNHYMDRRRLNPDLHTSFFDKSIKEFRKTYEAFFNTGEKTTLLRIVAPEQFKVTKAIISSNLDMAENKFHQKDYDSAVIYLEAALSSIHDLIDTLTNLLTS